MAFFTPGNEDDVMTDINMTPLIDVMLVLLIVFILAAPTIQSAIPLTLPRASANTTLPTSAPVQLDIDAQGQSYWNGKPVDSAQLRQLALLASAQAVQPMVLLRGDRTVPYERILQTLSTLQACGLVKVNFVGQQP
jgi:biopolymer transport protein ExbD